MGQGKVQFVLRLKQRWKWLLMMIGAQSFLGGARRCNLKLVDFLLTATILFNFELSSFVVSVAVGQILRAYYSWHTIRCVRLSWLLFSVIWTLESIFSNSTHVNFTLICNRFENVLNFRSYQTFACHSDRDRCRRLIALKYKLRDNLSNVVLGLALIWQLQLFLVVLRFDPAAKDVIEIELDLDVLRKRG